MSRILHLSDLHFGTEDPAVVQALLQLAEEHRPSLCLLSGDITQRARRSQFAAAGAFVHQLPAPVLAIPGNHDLPLFNLPLRLLNPYGNYRRVFGESLAPELVRDDVLVIGVNSTRAARHKNGEVSAEQIQQVARRLQQAKPDQLRVVMLHHPVCAIQSSDLANLLIGREQAVPAWVDAGMDLLLAGHIHLPYRLPLAGSGQRQAWSLQAGTGVSQRVRGSIPNSVNFIDYGSTNGQRWCQVTRWDYAVEQARFLAHERQSLPLHGSD
ncbi:DNA repair exonuclease [Pseudomonas sp. G11-1]|nr:DNA repair exonuclease [Pseudomonas sp. G11-1]MCO5788273.1 DNA repair exonuclease [Pseudomonas sp. G11-2]